MAIESQLGSLRLRVINTSPLHYFTDGFELGAVYNLPQLWHSLGTEAGTDNSINYWTQDNGVWTYASHLLSPPATVNAVIHGGHADWWDCTVLVRFKWVTGSVGSALMHLTDKNNWVSCTQNGATLFLQKDLGGVMSTIASIGDTLVNGTFYWLQISGTGTSYTATTFNDNAGALGTQRQTVNGIIADAALQNGYMGCESRTATACQFGGAFANVCQVTGEPPSGSQGQAWSPMVTSGEPAFAWSKVAPQAGTYSASIAISGGGTLNASGSWRQTIRLFGGSNLTLSGQQKASVGTANISAGGLTTGNAGSAFASASTTGAITTNPTVACNYAAVAAGTAYFDTLSITNPAYEITNNLPHLHQTHIDVVAMQPGNPGSAALGSWTVQLHPPGTGGYAAARAIYDQLDYFQRVEMYISPDGASLGKLYYAGIITGIRKTHGENSTLELSGVSDLFWLNYSRPLPGEVLLLDYGGFGTVHADVRQARDYFGTNELGASDAFSSFTAANYLSTSLPALSSGTWTASTDDSFNVVTDSSGTGAVLLSAASGYAFDPYQRHYAEVSGRLLPANDATNAGKFGIGLSFSSLTCQDCMVGYVTAKRVVDPLVGFRWTLDVTATVYKAGAAAVTQTSSAALTLTDDPEGYIPITIGIQRTLINYVQVTVNGKAIFSAPGIATGANDAAGAPMYPFLFFGTPASGTANGYFHNLVQMTKVTDDGIVPALFASGTLGTPAHSLPVFTDPGPTFLELITRVAAREGWYWRYTPKAYTLGTRTIGTIDLTADPGTDYGTTRRVVFSRTDGNLLDLQLSANADQFVTSTTVSGPSGSEGGGLAPWRDISSMTKYGVVEDQVLFVTAPTFNEQRGAAANVSNNRVNLSAVGSKTAVVLRDPQTADVARELDKVMIHDPETGISYLVARIVGYTFDEGQPRQTLTLDQFSVDDPTIPSKRLQQGVFQTAVKFGNR